jgi:hypothetical protein
VLLHQLHEFLALTALAERLGLLQSAFISAKHFGEESVDLVKVIFVMIEFGFEDGYDFC